MHSLKNELAVWGNPIIIAKTIYTTGEDVGEGAHICTPMKLYAQSIFF